MGLLLPLVTLLPNTPLPRLTHALDALSYDPPFFNSELNNVAPGCRMLWRPNISKHDAAITTMPNEMSK